MAQQRFLPDNQISLPLEEIQGDILIGLQKKAQVFDFLSITDSAAFTRDFATIVGDITFSDQTKQVEEHHPGPFLSLNVSFSAPGLAKVQSIPAPSLLDPSFAAGAKAQGPALGDDVSKWLPAYTNPIDLLLLITGVDLKSTQDQADSFINALRHSTSHVHRENGFIRAAQPGHEHNGFADGVSQPGVKGLTLPGATPDQGWPGQDLVDAGDFIFGDYDVASGGKATPPLPWMENGSYLVFRRLNQDVDAFWTWNKDPANLASTKSTSPEQLGAKLVGRWIDGSPLVLSPSNHDPARDENHPDANNDFNFGSDPKDPNADPHQVKCPFSAHIRKVYPRDDLANEASEVRRILRAGIPFGQDGDADKGLLFVCYQTSIVDKFEFIQKNWANNAGFIFSKDTIQGTSLIEVGKDPIIGLGPPRDIDQTSDDAEPKKAQGLPDFVTASGAGYFFSPSRTTLHAIAAGN